MTKVTMPEPVAYPSDDWVEAFFGLPDENGFYVFRGDFGNIADRFRIAAKCAGFITTEQAEAYADARVREALERAIEACKAYERRVEATFIDNNRVQHATGAVVGASACADAIRALIPPTE